MPGKLVRRIAVQALVLVALLLLADGKLLSKLLSGSGSGCGSSLQLPRLNLLSVLCRPSAGLWAGMPSYGQYPSYGKGAGLW